MQKVCRTVVILFFALAAGAVAAQTESRQSEQTAEEIERLVETLENPTERERLIGDLKLLLEVQEDGEDGAATPETPTSGDLLEVASKMLASAWDEITSVDPVAVVVSTSISIGVVLGALLVRWLLLALLRRIYARLTRDSLAADDDPATQTDETDEVESGDRVELPDTVSRLVSLVTGVLALGLIAESWGAGFADLLGTELGAQLAETALSVGLTLIVSVALLHAAEMLVERALRGASRKLDRERSVRRKDTLAPLLTNALKTAITIMAALLILSELGVNIGPLLAGAGILGLAVGFGAQSFVKDLITGVTMLLEDSATVGDVVEVAGHQGRVEEMRIRTMRLRDLSGTVHLIPYSEVSSVKNFTKDFSFYMFEVGVAYREDTDKVSDVLMTVSDDLCADETYRGDILEPLAILGVDQFADSAVIIKARIKTVAGQQWLIGREFNRRMKMRFDEEGIEIPFPHQTIYFGEPKEGKAPPAQLALSDNDGKLLQASADAGTETAS